MGTPDHLILKVTQSSVAWQRALAIITCFTEQHVPIKLVLMERGCTDFIQLLQ